MCLLVDLRVEELLSPVAKREDSSSIIAVVVFHSFGLKPCDSVHEAPQNFPQIRQESPTSPHKPKRPLQSKTSRPHAIGFPAFGRHGRGGYDECLGSPCEQQVKQILVMSVLLRVVVFVVRQIRL